MATIKNKEGMTVVGWLVNWSARGLSVDRDELLSKLAQVGIDATVARAVLPKNAAIRAVREHGKGEGRMHKKVADESAAAAFAIMETEVELQGQVTADFDVGVNVPTKILFDKADHTLKVMGKSKAAIEKTFQEKLVTYSSDQFRSIVLRYVKRECEAVTYLETGNIYFVPAAKEAALNRLVKFFELMGPGCALNIKEEISTEQVRKVMWNIAFAEMEHDIEQLTKDLDNNEPQKARSMQIRLDKYKRLRTKVEMFEVAMQSTGDRLKSKLDKLTKAVQTQLGV